MKGANVYFQTNYIEDESLVGTYNIAYRVYLQLYEEQEIIRRNEITVNVLNPCLTREPLP